MSNILVDIRSLLDKPYTGVAQYTLNFLNEVLEKDKENQYFLFYNSHKFHNSDFKTLLPKFGWAFSGTQSPRGEGYAIRVLDSHYPNKIFNFLLWLFNWPKIDKLVEKKTGQKIDEIFLPNFNFGAFSKNKKITLVVHDLSFEIYPRFFTLKQRLWHKLVNPRKLCQKASKIITHSENTKNDLIRFYKIDPSKIEVKKPPIAQNFFQTIDEKEKARVKEKYQLPDNFILYLGRLEPRKNLDTVIRAFYQLITHNSIKNNSLIIAGQGQKLTILKLLKFLSKKAKKIHQEKTRPLLFLTDFCEGKIRFLGYVPEEDKKALYHLAKLFVYPSFYEGYGYPVAEALACGLPVITSHTSSLTEIEGENIIFINPYDINDLVEAIKRHEKLE